YMRTARAKGLAPHVVVLKHGLRNAAIPLITFLGLQTGLLLGGTVVVEEIFGWPGVGRLLLQAISYRDYPVVQAATFILAMIFVAGSVVVSSEFQAHRDLQSICDGAATAAANSIDLSAERAALAADNHRYLHLGSVDQTLQTYLARDPRRQTIQIQAALSPDGTIVMLRCSQTSKIAFGAMFGLAGGITSHVTSQARSPVGT
ncbi:MAG: ABC transporter permease, partial [Actinobacteria bacterium]|nr:ABC transporter permease [Actinomycetota bacterium]